MSLTSTFHSIITEQLLREAPELNLSPATEHNLKEIGRTFGSGYVKWILIQIQNENLEEEDVYKYMEFFKYYNQGKRLGHFTFNDIFKYKDSKEFEAEAIKSHQKIIGFTGELKSDNNPKDLVSSKQIQNLEDVGIKFLGITPDGYQCFKIPQDLRDSEDAFEAQKNILGRCQGREVGEEIRICTMGNYDHFSDYLTEDDLYVFFNLKDPLSPYQFHYQSNSYLDKNDHTINEARTKSFFKFLQEKDERQITAHLKLRYFKDEFTTEDIIHLSISDRYKYFPQALTPEDWNNIWYGDGTVKIRTDLMNDLVVKDGNKIQQFFGRIAIGQRRYFDEVMKFGQYAPNIALVTLTKAQRSPLAQKYSFINKKGQPDITGVNPVDLMRDTHILLGYLNIKNPELAKDTYFTHIDNPRETPEHVILNGRFFINMNGQLDLPNIDPNDLNGDNRRAVYINTLIQLNPQSEPLLWLRFLKDSKSLFSQVSKFGTYGKDIAYATLNQDGNIKPTFINRTGETDVTGIDPQAFGIDSMRLLYFNMVQNKIKFERIEYFKHNLWIATDSGGDNFIINDQGIPSVGNTTIKESLRHLEAYFNTIQNNLKFTYVSQSLIEKTNSNNLFIASIRNPKTSEPYEFYIFCDEHGQPNVQGLDIKTIKNYEVNHGTRSWSGDKTFVEPQYSDAYENTVNLINNNFYNMRQKRRMVNAEELMEMKLITTCKEMKLTSTYNDILNEGKLIRHKWEKIQDKKLKHAKCERCRCEKYFDDRWGKVIFIDRFGKTHHRAPECVLPNTKL